MDLWLSIGFAAGTAALGIIYVPLVECLRLYKLSANVTFVQSTDWWMSNWFGLPIFKRWYTCPLPLPIVSAMGFAIFLNLVGLASETRPDQITVATMVVLECCLFLYFVTTALLVASTSLVKSGAPTRAKRAISIFVISFQLLPFIGVILCMTLIWNQ